MAPQHPGRDARVNRGWPRNPSRRCRLLRAPAADRRRVRLEYPPLDRLPRTAALTPTVVFPAWNQHESCGPGRCPAQRRRSPSSSNFSTTWRPTKTRADSTTSPQSASSTRFPDAPPSSAPSWARSREPITIRWYVDFPHAASAPGLGLARLLAPGTAADPGQRSRLPSPGFRRLYSIRHLGRRGNA